MSTMETPQVATESDWEMHFGEERRGGEADGWLLEMEEGVSAIVTSPISSRKALVKFLMMSTIVTAYRFYKLFLAYDMYSLHVWFLLCGVGGPSLHRFVTHMTL